MYAGWQRMTRHRYKHSKQETNKISVMRKYSFSNARTDSYLYRRCESRTFYFACVSSNDERDAECCARNVL